MKLKRYFTGQKGFVAVYLFGSRARARAREDSDVDIAILFKKNDSGKMFDKSLKISVDLMKLLKVSRVDVISLNSASPVVKNQVYKYGREIFCSNKVNAIRFKARSSLEYLDILPARKLCAQALKRKALGNSKQTRNPKQIQDKSEIQMFK